MIRPQSNARSATRFQALVPAVAHIGGAAYPCEATNLSRSGALLVGCLPQPQEGATRIVLSSPAGDLRLDVEGILVRIPATAADDDRIPGLAVRFPAMPPDQQALLESLISRVIEGGTTLAAVTRLRPGASRSEIVEALGRVPLAHRVALAGRAQVREREMLRLDTHPEVLNALARNPQLSFPEAQALLRLRTLSATALDSMARDGRWRDERLRVLIAAHPNTPQQLAESLALGLSPAGRERVLQAPSLSEALRQRLLQKGSRLGTRREA
jgi:hypothetical protein